MNNPQFVDFFILKAGQKEQKVQGIVSNESHRRKESPDRSKDSIDNRRESNIGGAHEKRPGPRLLNELSNCQVSRGLCFLSMAKVATERTTRACTCLTRDIKALDKVFV